MNSMNEIRQTLIAAFKVLHEANYPSMPVNYPNEAVVDLENFKEPFVKVELTFSGEAEIYDVSAGADINRGNLRIYFLYPAGTGGNGSLSYTDLLKANLCYSKIGGITMKGLAVTPVSPYPGIIGQMNAISFII